MVTDSGDMLHARKVSVWASQKESQKVRVGYWVEVLYGYTPGVCNDGGTGMVIKVQGESIPDPTVEEAMTVDVKYILDNRIEKNITLDRITVVPFMPFSPRELRPRQSASDVDIHSRDVRVATDKTSMQWLKEGLKTRRHEKRGWLRDLLIHEGILELDLMWNRILSDYRCQVAAVDGMREVLGDSFEDPRTHLHYPGTDSGGKFVSAKKESQRDVPKNVYTIGYLLHAYDVSRTSFYRYRKTGPPGEVSRKIPTNGNAGKHVITDRAFAKAQYDARYFFIRDKMFDWDVPRESSAAQLCTLKEGQKRFGPVYDALRAEKGKQYYYEAMARDHDSRQPFIKDELTDALNVNASRSFEQLAKHIDNWCSAAAIKRWFYSMDTYKMYAKNIKPGITTTNSEKQVLFSQRVHNRWDLDKTAHPKILWIMSDEKWFYAMISRRNAKCCEELGIKKQSFSAHHKKHIAKVMAHATVGMLFDGSVEDGGKGFLIGLHRCCAHKVPLRDIKYSSRDPVTGKITFKGNKVKYKKGIPYLVDCNVTGSNPGTPTQPFFPLQRLWEHYMIPKIEAMVAPGGPCAGATVVYQEDNAGPHLEGTYSTFMDTEFARRGWKRENQAPQGAAIFFVCLPGTNLISSTRPISQCPGSVIVSNDVQEA